MATTNQQTAGNSILSIPTTFLMIVLWVIGVQHYLVHQDVLLLLFFGYLGLTIGAGIGGYLAAPDRFRPYARRMTTLLIGSLLLATAFISDHGNMQLEGLWFALMVGGGFWIILHFLLAKILIPLALGRIWCSWACWYSMIFDLLPYPFSRYRCEGHWGLLRYLHFALSIAVVGWLVALGYREGAEGMGAMTWFALGVLLYYIVGVVMTLLLKDNRAFCKYLCPIAVPLKEASRFSLVKISGVPDHCADCEACVEMCPMNIRVKDYVLAGERILSTECTLCQTCINACPFNSLKLSVGLDVGGKERFDYDPTKGNHATRENGRTPNTGESG